MQTSLQTKDAQNALMELGQALAETGWQYEIPLGELFGSSERDNEKYYRRLGVIFITRNMNVIKSYVCENGKPKTLVSIGADYIAIFASEACGSLGVDPILAEPIVRSVLALGLDKICAKQ